MHQVLGDARALSLPVAPHAHAAVVDVVALEVVTFEVGAVVDAVAMEVGAVADAVALEVAAVVDAVVLEVVALEVGDVVDAEEFSPPRVITFPLRLSDTAKNCDQ